MDSNGHKRTFGGNLNVLKLDYGDSGTVEIYLKNPWTEHLQCLNFMACQLHINKIVYQIKCKLPFLMLILKPTYAIINPKFTYELNIDKSPN